MKEQVIQLGGGLDTTASPIGMPAGNVIGSENYEARLRGGYERLKGVERFDGRAKPSAAQFIVLGALAWGAGAVVGATLTGDTSGATGVIAYVSGTLLAVTKVVGDFDAGEDVSVSAVVVATSISVEPSISAAQANTMYGAAADIYRADISTVPGSGPVRGVCAIGADVFAFRDNSAGTQQDVWKATSAGWVAIPHPETWVAFFDAGAGTDPLGSFGLTLVQGGVTANIHRVMRGAGDWTVGDGEGTMALQGPPSGGSFVFGAAQIMQSATLIATVNLSVVRASPLYPGGKWQFKPYRFTSVDLGMSAGTVPVYGLDRTAEGGGGNFIEFDGQCVVPLLAGGIDGPWRMEIHKQHLFVSFREATLRHSALGDPYDWTVLSGAGEILVGDRINEMVSMQGAQDSGALAIIAANKTQVLYGTSSADWNLVTLSDGVGGKQYSAQIMGSVLALDEQGIRSYSPTDAFGNFAYATLTDHIRNKVTGRAPVTSVVDRAGGHYRVFFDDGEFLSGVPGKRWAWMLCRYPFAVYVAHEYEIAGVSTIFLGAANGYVYQADVGRSFDGAAITAWLKTAYAHLGSPHMRKAFKMALIEVRSDSVGTIYVQPDYSYGDTAIDDQDAAIVINSPVLGSDAAFDLGSWDVGTWDAKYQSSLRVRAPGVGENVSLLIYSQSAVELSHELTAVTHLFLPRRQVR